MLMDKLAFLCVVCTSLNHVTGVQFVMPPRSVNATVNSTVSFQCGTTVGATAHRWSISGTLVLVESIGRHGSTSEVKLFCTEDQNLSEVICGLRLVDRSGFSMLFNASVLEVRCGVRVVNNGTLDTIFSDPALLQIQGLLGPVTNLMVLSTTNTSITLTWDPPFSLDITGVEPDFTHTVEVYNVTEGERELVNITRNITDSTFTFSLVNPDPLDLFQFVVFAVNVVGEGESSDPVYARFSEDVLTTVSPTTTTTTGTTSASADDLTAGIVSMETSTTGSELPGQTSDSLLVPVTVTAFVVGVILGVVATLLIGLLIIVCKRHTKGIQPTASIAEEEEIELKRCDAYDVVSKRKKNKRRPVVNPPPVYEEVDL